jgi:hypothetical protein
MNQNSKVGTSGRHCRTVVRDHGQSLYKRGFLRPNPADLSAPELCPLHGFCSFQLQSTLTLQLPIVDIRERRGNWHAEVDPLVFSPVGGTWGRAINLQRP